MACMVRSLEPALCLMFQIITVTPLNILLLWFIL